MSSSPARRTGSPVLLLLAMVAWFGVVLGCGVLAGELLQSAERSNGSTPIDSSITSWMVAHRAHGVTAVARLLSVVGSQLVLAPVAAVTVALLLGRRRFVVALFLGAAWAGAIGLYSLTKHFVARMRPPADIRLVHVDSSSFPSGHATQSLATFVLLAALAAVAVARVRSTAAVAVALGLAGGVGWSRVYLGAHWSTDVIAGWLMGAAWVGAVLWLEHRAPRG
ncbi:MAG: phosphatase PAP2 family protein [Solirubrobacteraceae bacterium]